MEYAPAHSTWCILVVLVNLYKVIIIIQKLFPVIVHRNFGVDVNGYSYPSKKNSIFFFLLD